MAARTRPRRRCRLALILASVAVVTSTTASPAAPDAQAAAARNTRTGYASNDSQGADSPLTAQDQAYMIQQAPYMALNDQVYTALGGDVSSLAGTQLDVPDSRLYVYLVGPPPDALTELSQSAAAEGIQLEIVAASHSLDELRNAAWSLQGRLNSTMPVPFRVELETDGSALTIDYSGSVTPTSPSMASAFSAAQQIANSSGVAVRWASDPEAASVGTSREDDSSPYRGGAVTASVYGECTSGFSAYATGDPDEFMLSVGHCTHFFDGVAVTNGVGASMGTSDFIGDYLQAPSYDLAVIKLNPGYSNVGRIYTSETGSISIAGYDDRGIPANGRYCISGAVGVPNCNLYSAKQTIACDVFDGVKTCFYVIVMNSLTGGAIVCDGDSGGPIYYFNGTAYVAAGLQSQGFYSGTKPPPCFDQAGASVVASALNRINGLAIAPAG